MMTTGFVDTPVQDRLSRQSWRRRALALSALRMAAASNVLVGGRLARRDFRRRVDRFLQTGQHESGDGEALLRAFLESGGTWLTDAALQTAASCGQSDLQWADDTLHLFEDPEKDAAATVQSLRENGYAILDVTLSEDITSELHDYFVTAPCTLTSDGDSPIPPGQTTHVDFGAPLAPKYAVLDSWTIRHPTVRRLMLDRGLLQIAQAYLGSAPTVDITAAWFSFPATGPCSEAGQLFHFDLDRIRWLKVFFMLTDQDGSNGAHVFVPGTHQDGGISPALLRKGYARLGDDDVARHHPRQGWRTMTGVRGTILLEDTRGLHKGLPVDDGYRLMLQFEYAQSLFGHPAGLSALAAQRLDEPFWQEAMTQCPRIVELLTRP